ncbi:MAG: hypothetical protein IIX08_09560 [Bacteroidales bacterium]|nr:hypothetical protein [Bacteroidales bacterium]
MKSKAFNRFYLFSCLGVLIASYYPLSMGVRVITDMLINGTVMKENYPKYIIPYTPISIAIIVGVLLMPLFIRFFKRFAFAGGAFVATGIFFGSELLFEQKVVVSTAETVTKLEDWQMFMCYVPPEGWGETVTTYKTQTAVDILMGDYNPAFKLHFYIISVVLIITILNCLYGFGQMIKNGDKKRCKSLILQYVCSLVFLGLCILACFTAFWRDGSIRVSPLSASLMTVFFILLGVTAGVFVGSFLLGKRKLVSVWIPAISASVMTLLMYIGEMFLLNGHLYSLGTGFLFESLPGIVFAPIDLLVILLSGSATALFFALLNNNRDDSKTTQKRSIIALSVLSVVVALTIALALCIGGTSTGDISISSMGGVDGPERTYRTVQLLEKKTDNTESTYEVGTYLNGIDFSSMGQELTSKIEKEWKTYSAMTESQRLTSSHLWGLVSFQKDTWNECEAAAIQITNSKNFTGSSMCRKQKTSHLSLRLTGIVRRLSVQQSPM